MSCVCIQGACKQKTSEDVQPWATFLHWYFKEYRESLVHKSTYRENTIGNIVKVMREARGIQERKVNHSAWKTAISSLVRADVSPTLIQQLSGHKNLNSINSYSAASYDQQRKMSSILTNYSSSSQKWLKPPATAAECSVYTSPDSSSLSC